MNVAIYKQKYCKKKKLGGKIHNPFLDYLQNTIIFRMGQFYDIIYN